jgi:hypothetical protein
MEWKHCPSYPKYEVSGDGQLRNLATGRLLKPFLARGGYASYHLSRDGKRTNEAACRLVLEAFVGPPPFDGAQACHNDGGKTNDHYRNLRWDGFQGNAADRKKHGTETLGEKNGQSKLTASEVKEIRDLWSIGLTNGILSDKFNVAKSVISDIVNRKAWTHVS